MALSRIAIRSKGTAGYLRYYATLDDAYQDVQIFLWEKRHTYDPARGSPAQWAMYWARKALQAGLRRGSNRGAMSLRCSTAMFARMPDRVGMTDVAKDDRAFDIADAHDDIITLLRRVKPEHRQIVKMLAEGLSNAEVGRRLGLCRERIRMVSNRAMEQMRRAA